MANREGDTDDSETRSVEESLSGELRSEFREKEPSEDEKEELRQEHEHHLVRRTESTVSVEPELAVDGMSAEAEVAVPDTYCFTCGEWVGVSGVDLRGTPRSKEEAFYLNGPPEELVKVSDEVRESMVALAVKARDEIEYVETLEDGAEFVADELAQVRGTLAEMSESENAD